MKSLRHLIALALASTLLAGAGFAAATDSPPAKPACGEQACKDVKKCEQCAKDGKSCEKCAKDGKACDQGAKKK